jgi:hypothetical protein
VDSNIQAISLLPSLCAEGEKLCLDISTIKTGPDTSGGQVGIFTAEYTSDCLAVGFNAQIRTDFGSLVKPVMLLIQRDHYPFLDTNTLSVTNSTIDKSWSRAAKYSDVHGVLPDQIMFSEQFGDGGELLPFAPLFFCSKRELFFHPPCFRCGRMLSSCRDDELLGKSGFPHYSKSLRRYLYCSTCTPVHGEPWYARTTNSEENSAVKDPGQLIHDFGSIRSDPEPDTHFPCADCSFHEECYEAGTEAVDAIKYFSFYPFYMVLTRRCSCNGHDYLAMVSGASTEQLADYWSVRGVTQFTMNNGELVKNREDVGFLHPIEDSRHFIEVLYLKIKFLKSVVEHFLNNTLSGRLSGHYIPLNTVGISLLSNSSLPSFWSFSVTHLGLGADFSEVIPYPKKSEPNHTYTIGLLWFVVLLANKRQGEAEIFQRLKSLLESDGENNSPLGKTDDTFRPYQLFWSAKDESVNTSHWNEQWDKILGIGQELLLAGYHNDYKEKADILETIDTCLTDLKGHVLTSARVEVTPSPDTEDIQISNIIEKVKEKWEREAKHPRIDHETAQTEFEEFAYPDTDHYVKQKNVPENDPDKTVIISPGLRATQLTATDAGINNVAGNTNAFEETVVISPNENLQQAGPDIPEKTSDYLQDMVPSPEVDDLEKTVRITMNPVTNSENTEKSLGSQENGGQDNAQQYDDEIDFLTETVVLRPIKKDG